MNKLWIGAVSLVFLASCASTKPKDGSAGVDDRSVTPAPSSTSGADTSGASSDSVGGDPLNDPNNILSKRSIYFEYDSAAITPEYRPVVEAHAKYIQERADKSVTVQGNTDDRGSREYNLALGQRRADSVKRTMTLLGAPADRIEAVSFGEEKPRAQGGGEEAWRENRRADVVYAGE